MQKKPSNLSSAIGSQGFTLVELLVAMTVTFFLIGAVIMIFSSGRATSLDVTQLSRMQENIRFASDYLVRDMRNAGFRDEAFLKIGHEMQIRQQYIAILNGGATLRLRYAGRGHCQEAFDEFRIVENEYMVNAETEILTCRGRSIPQSASGVALIEDQTFSPAIGLISGVNLMAFQLVCPDGGTTCPCNLVDNADSSCVGIRVGLSFSGMRSLDGTDSFEDRSVELVAAFRNVLLDRMNSFRFGG